ncbi:hypothetical protein ACJJTC_016202 [Scirpophaga incertulas]
MNPSMKPGYMPTKFTCQPGRKTQTSNTTERPYIAKKRRMMILEECENRFEGSTIVEEPSSSKEIASCSSGFGVNLSTSKLHYSVMNVPAGHSTEFKSPVVQVLSILMENYGNDLNYHVF